eukprot:3382861-Lingulodinium_polyedra.AAC.1
MARPPSAVRRVHCAVRLCSLPGEHWQELGRHGPGRSEIGRPCARRAVVAKARQCDRAAVQHQP